MLYLKLSLWPTVTLYELGLEGVADQNGELEELEPMVTVVVARESS